MKVHASAERPHLGTDLYIGFLNLGREQEPKALPWRPRIAMFATDALLGHVLNYGSCGMEAGAGTGVPGRVPGRTAGKTERGAHAPLTVNGP